MVGDLGPIFNVMGDPLLDEVQVTPRCSYRSDVKVWIFFGFIPRGNTDLPSFGHSDDHGYRF